MAEVFINKSTSLVGPLIVGPKAGPINKISLYLSKLNSRTLCSYIAKPCNVHIPMTIYHISANCM